MNINLVAKLLSEGESAESARAIAEQYEMLNEGKKSKSLNNIKKLIDKIENEYNKLSNDEQNYIAEYYEFSSSISIIQEACEEFKDNLDID